MQRDEDLDPADLKQTAGRKREHDPAKLLALIASNDAANPISVSEWARLAEMPRKTLTDYLAEMRGKGWIKTIGEGSRAKQAITNEGKAILNK
jgi:predicted transcriptional regulator